MITFLYVTGGSPVETNCWCTSHLMVEVEIMISVDEDGGSLAGVHQTRVAICDPVSRCRMSQISGNLYKNAEKI
jgi:hypothetical protein